MRRYLVFFCYKGTNFCGLNKQKDVKTVTQVLEKSLEVLCPDIKPRIVNSSRTDKGVHALCNTCHVDLCHGKEYEFHSDVVTVAMNQWLLGNDKDVRVIKTLRVPNDFHSRFQAKGRTYIYRISLNNTTKQNEVQNKWKVPLFPVDSQYSYFVSDPIDMSVFRQALKLLEGKNNFSAFTSPSKLKPYQNPVKDMKVKIIPRNVFMGEHLPHSFMSDYNHWDLEFTANSFLFQQVRKMTAVLLNAGRGYMPLGTIENMINHPTQQTSKLQKYCMPVPPHALFLKEIMYEEKDFIIPDEEEKNTKVYNPFKMVEGCDQVVKSIMKKRHISNFYRKDIFDMENQLTKQVLEKCAEFKLNDINS